MQRAYIFASTGEFVGDGEGQRAALVRNRRNIWHLASRLILAAVIQEWPAGLNSPAVNPVYGLLSHRSIVVEIADIR